ncbi:MAG: Gfo/Idh/MocA family oxidoreductase [Microcella sp.]|uniref:Gfo/Idh/MocA family protein n=1 Tax=Microcella sp. TaxID=1913979 RepID=UPI0024C7A29E|nr:Gfo/Idh/MocA family oxidoreductase [Microcella sp.]UYN84474.1 MAG: Gfo/Idh/MocA family oxidoreductase [Microcella sp.]
MSTPILGVGIIGAGPVTQAIHLPTLSRLEDLFRVVHIMDVDAEVAASVAARVGAKATTSIDDVLGDDEAQIIVICSPSPFHAEQVIAACRAGKTAVLCEKPFAMSAEEAEQIAAVSADTGVPIIVGAMHTFDPGWLAARQHWADLVESVHTIRYSVVLPPNARFEDVATEVLTRPVHAPADPTDPEVAFRMLRGGILGLAIHDLPLVRVLCSDVSRVEVLSATALDPSGYSVTLRVGDCTVEMLAIFSQGFSTEWYLEAIADDRSLRIDFTPSYVHAGSATATLFEGTSARVLGPFSMNGYEGEWRFLADLAHGTAEPIDVHELVDDLRFALEVSDLASAAARDNAISMRSTREA